MTVCTVIAAGRISHPAEFTGRIRESDLVICVDGGAGHLRKMGILPHIIVGDMDSIAREDLLFFRQKQVRFVRYPEKKDATDTELAVMTAVKAGATDITLIGGSGTRLDHTLANILLLKRIADRQISCRMIDGHNEIFIVRDRMSVRGNPGDLLSVLPLTLTADGITLTGLEYPLTDATISLGSSIGISNRFVEAEATIQVKEGILIGFKSRD